jgi:hypothetical protein
MSDTVRVRPLFGVTSLFAFGLIWLRPVPSDGVAARVAAPGTLLVD